MDVVSALLHIEGLQDDDVHLLGIVGGEAEASRLGGQQKSQIDAVSLFREGHEEFRADLRQQVRIVHDGYRDLVASVELGETGAQQRLVFLRTLAALGDAESRQHLLHERTDSRRRPRVDVRDTPLAVGREQELIEESRLTRAFDAAHDQYEIAVLDQVLERVALLRECRCGEVEVVDFFDREWELAYTVSRQGVVEGEGRNLFLLHVSHVKVDALNIRSCSAMAKRSVIPAM